MSEFKGTKGKWSFSSQKGTKNHCFVAQVWSDKQEYYLATINTTEHEYEANANAKLIACAPEILEILKNILENTDKMVQDGKPTEAYYQLMNKAEQIVKKATE